MPGILSAAGTIKRATLPALFLASTATVKLFVHPSSYVEEGAAMTIWEIYALYSFVSVLSAQTTANYRLQRKRQADQNHEQLNFEGCAVIQVKWFAYAMVLCKGVNSAISIMDSMAEVPKGSTHLSSGLIEAGSVILAVFFGLAQSYGQLGSLLVAADAEDPDEEATMNTWRERAERISPALPIIVGSASDAWFYNVTLFSAASKFFGFMFSQEHALHVLSAVSGDASNPSDNTRMMLGNGLFWGISLLNVFTFIIVAQGWLEKTNAYLELAAEDVYNFPEWFQMLVRKTAFKYNDEESRFEEWQPLRHLVTHIKSFTGGISLAAIVIDLCNDHDINTSVKGVDLLKFIAPIIVLIGHAELSTLHNLVNSTEGQIPNLWNGYGLFNCMHSICCEPRAKDNEDFLLDGYNMSLG